MGLNAIAQELALRMLESHYNSPVTRGNRAKAKRETQRGRTTDKKPAERTTANKTIAKKPMRRSVRIKNMNAK
ncbi:hypothetical protein RclHR1_10980006 [Rhizophagus clarus]|uniref:Uncharacterized protein n=1 Tax=Rhizophagus clarus TaxID=94130 RepID=A0A2Z6QHT0_9GLOM|nr:hypothetical protein RclHR1_10980006 [Rhizophagus clarus]GET04519.1 hypothetical protein RCL_jg7921.t1 [Rhizophagus clarus]